MQTNPAVEQSISDRDEVMHSQLKISHDRRAEKAKFAAVVL